MLGGLGVFNHLLVALVAGLGATVGEYSAYLLDHGGRRFVSKRYEHKMDLLCSFLCGMGG